METVDSPNYRQDRPEFYIENIQQELEASEAGVLELLRLYERLEPVYADAASVSAVTYAISVSNSTNPSAPHREV
jgi:hypothetical protein